MTIKKKRIIGDSEEETDSSVHDEHTSQSPVVQQVVEVVEEVSESPKQQTPPTNSVQPEVDVSTPQITEVELPKSVEPTNVLGDLYRTKTTDFAPEYSHSEKKRGIPSLIVWVLIVIGVALLTGTTLMVLVKGIPKMTVVPVKPTPTSIMLPTPTSTPVPTANKADLKIQVLNGGGTPGAAGKMKKTLEESGYTVTNVGNTDEYTYTKTEVVVKDGSDATKQLIISDITGTYSLGTSSAVLAADSSYDAQVIVGKE